MIGLQLPLVSHWLSALPVALLESLLRAGISSLDSARVRDTLLCLMTCCLDLGVRSLTLPASLVMDEASRWTSSYQNILYYPITIRLYLLDLLHKQEKSSNLRSLSCECYHMNMVR